MAIATESLALPARRAAISQVVSSADQSRHPLRPGPARSSLSTISGWSSAKSIAIRPPSDRPTSDACCTARCCRRSEEHTSELQSPCNLVCRLLLEKKKNKNTTTSDKSNQKCVSAAHPDMTQCGNDVAT